jgi:sulfur carrier protein ThiS
MESKNNINEMLERLQTVPSYVDLTQIDSQIDFNHPINHKDLESINYLPQDDTLSFNPIGIFNIGTVQISDGEAAQKDPRIISHVTVGQIDDLLILQIDDLPLSLAYEIRNLEELEEFLSIYELSSIGTEPENRGETDKENDDNIVVALFDLRRNSEYKPIMMERYMMLSRFAQPYVYGPYCNSSIIEAYLVTGNSFNISVQYYDIMRQNEDSFAINTRTRYSKSLITVKFTESGVIAEVEYVPILNTRIEDIISSYNGETDSDLPLDLPVDVLLFLTPIHPWRSRRLYDEIIKKSVEPRPQIVSVFDKIFHPSLFTDIDKPYQGAMKNIFELCNGESDQSDMIREMIRVNITGEYVEAFKETYDSDRDTLDLEKAITKIQKQMELEDNKRYVSETYLEYALSNFFQIFDDDSDIDSESGLPQSNKDSK